MKNNFSIILAIQGKTLMDVHRVTNLSMTTLSAIKNQKAHNPGSKTIIKIADYLEVSIDEFLGREKLTLMQSI